MNLDDFLPSLERVKAKKRHIHVGRSLGLFGGKDLLASDGVTREPVCAVLVVCYAVVRTRKDSEREIGPYRANQMFRGEPPLPVTPELRNMEVLVDARPIGPCSQCAAVGNLALRPGRLRCNECSGTGRVANTGVPMGGIIVSAVVEAIGSVCPACQGETTIACPTCEGTGQSMLALVSAVSDTPAQFSYVYVPSLSATLEEKVEEALRSEDVIPACLRIAESYAGDSVNGFALGDRLGRARDAISRAMGGGQIVVGELNLFAWPMLVLRSDDGRGSAAIFVSPRGELRSFVEG
jgi:hypothetical protein